MALTVSLSNSAGPDLQQSSPGRFARPVLPRSGCPRSIRLPLASALFAAALIACRTPLTHPRAGRAEVLQSLRQCLAEIPRQTHDGFISPCAYSDVSSLNGIPRAELIAALDHTPACTNPKYLSEWYAGPDCPRPAEQDPMWLFFVQPQTVTGGGAPFLVCEAQGTANCVRLVWTKSK
jgi:hypothetical protein